MSWGAYIQGGENFESIDKLGAELSKQINCPVHYPAFNKSQYECWHNIVFPLTDVASAYGHKKWNLVIGFHDYNIEEQNKKKGGKYVSKN